MSRADETKSLQVEASLLRLALDHERTVSQAWQAACAVKDEALAAANARIAELEKARQKLAQLAIDSRDVAALAAARRECELLRAALRNDGQGSWWMCGNCDGWMIPDGGDDQCHCDYGAAARAALAAPAAAAGEEGT